MYWVFCGINYLQPGNQKMGDLERLSWIFLQCGGSLVLQKVFESAFIIQVCHSSSLQYCFTFTVQAVLEESVCEYVSPNFP